MPQNEVIIGDLYGSTWYDQVKNASVAYHLLHCKSFDVGYLTSVYDPGKKKDMWAVTNKHRVI